MSVKRLLQHFGHRPPMSVLDLGCGKGAIEPPPYHLPFDDARFDIKIAGKPTKQRRMQNE